MNLIDTPIPGCYEIVPKILKDERGFFVKTFHRDIFQEKGLETRFVEAYYSFSHRGVLRGLHFQTPPMEHAKLVYCVAGDVVDVVVDLRTDSPAYGRFVTFDLKAEEANMVYIPPGLAHGFYVVSESALMMYNVTSVYSPGHDTGILWNSLGIPWPDENPIISPRDRGFVPFSEFDSPFRYGGAGR